jgi:hypothetical protein
MYYTKEELVAYINDNKIDNNPTILDEISRDYGNDENLADYEYNCNKCYGLVNNRHLDNMFSNFFKC